MPQSRCRTDGPAFPSHTNPEVVSLEAMFVLVGSRWLEKRLDELGRGPGQEATFSQPRTLPSPGNGAAALVVTPPRWGPPRLLVVGKFTRHGTAATDRDVAVRLDRVTSVDPPLPVSELLNELPTSLRRHLLARVSEGGHLPPTTDNAVHLAISRLAPEAAAAIAAIERELQAPSVTGPSADRWAVERDAVLLSAKIGDFGAESLEEWSEPGDDQPVLAGLLGRQEAAEIDFDASHFPGLRALPRVHTSIHVFTDGDRRLEVVNANASGVETALGTDLLYFHHQTESFVLVQYKKANQSGSLQVDDRLLDQIVRMEKFVAGSADVEQRPESWRLGLGNAAWLKVVKPGPFRVGPTSLLSGMYLPADYCRRLLSATTSDTPEVTALSFETVQRYVTNKLFVALVREGWVGTTGISPAATYDYVKHALRRKRSVVVAEEHGFQDPSARRRSTSRKERLIGRSGE